jgi:hypothetical protein
MSIGASMLAMYSFLRNEGALDGVNTVADIGSIEYEMKFPEHDRVFEEFFKSARVPVPTGRNPETGLYKGGARAVYENLGYEYKAFDIDGRFGSFVFDLNYDHVPAEFIGWADLTANLGTVEHVFNQVNCFRVVHDLTKTGGLMIHLSPLNDSIYHGLFRYSPRLFYATGEYNDYEMLGQWASTPDPSFWLPTSAKKRFLMYSAVMVTLMRKKKASEFVIPLQIDTPMEPEKGALARYNVNSFAKHMPTPPKYDFGFKVDFATLESRRLTMKQVMADESLGMLAEGGPEGPRAKILMMENELRRRLQSPKWAVRDGIRGIAGLMRRAASRL